MSIKPIFRSGAIQVGRKYMSGVHSIIESVFAPSFRHADIKKNTLGPRAKPSTITTPYGSSDPKRIGNWVDRSVGSIVNICNHFPDLSVQDMLSNNVSLDVRTNRAYRLWDLADRDVTRALMSWLVRENLRPVGSQIPVAIERCRMGTMLDLLVQHNDEKWFAVVEIKCGYEDFLWADTGAKMKAPFQRLTASTGNQHMIQLYLSAIMADETFRDFYPKYLPLRIDKSKLVVISRDTSKDVRAYDFGVFDDIFTRSSVRGDAILSVASMMHLGKKDRKRVRTDELRSFRREQRKRQKFLSSLNGSSLNGSSLNGLEDAVK